MHLSPLQDLGGGSAAGLAWPGPAPVSVSPQRRKLHKPDLSQLQEYTAFRCLTVLSLGNASGGVGCGFSSPRTLLESTQAHQAGRSWGPGRAGPQGQPRTAHSSQTPRPGSQPITPPSASSPLPPGLSGDLSCPLRCLRSSASCLPGQLNQNPGVGPRH